MKTTTLLLTSLLLSLSTFAVEKNMMARMRAITINPDESGTPTVIGGDVTLSNVSVPEIDFTYFFTKNIAVELILATASHEAAVKAQTTGTATNLGSVTLLPPTLTVQYHFNGEKWKPYIGAGLNYTTFYGVQPGAVKSVDYDSSLGLALQAGTDYSIGNDLYINLDVKKAMISTEANVITYTDAAITADIDIDPWIIGLGLGVRF